MKALSVFVVGCMSFLSLAFPWYAQADTGDVVFSEIMYDLEGVDTNREWIELKNTTAQAIDISGWKLFDGSNHILNEPPENGGQGSLLIPPLGFVVIATHALQFKIDNPNYTGTLIDSSFSLNNTGDTIKMIDANQAIASEVTYASTVGAAGDGNSLQLYQSGWITSPSTPGGETVVQTQSNTTNTNSSSGGGSSSVSTVKPVFLDSKKEPVWSAHLALSAQSVFTFAPFTITPKITSPKGTQHTIGRFVYTLGDGRVFERENASPVSIEYAQAGSYVLFFEYFENKKDAIPVISERLLLSVEDTPILVTLDKTKGYTVKISNTHTKDINISGWTLSDGTTSFVFPKNTFLPGDHEVTLSSHAHTLSQDTLRLLTPTGHAVAVFPQQKETRASSTNFLPSLKTIFDDQPEQLVPKAVNTVSGNQLFSHIEKQENEETNESTSSYGASHQLSAQVPSVASSSNVYFWLFIGLLGCIGACMFIFLRTIKTPKEPATTGVDTEASGYTIEEIKEKE